MARNRFGGALLLASVVWAVGGCKGGCQGPEPEEEPELPLNVPAEDLKALADGNNQFAVELYKQLAAKQDGNIILSPYSISSALAMTYAGAKGETADQMARTLHFTLPPDRLHQAFAGTTRKLTTAGQTDAGRLRIANAMWVQDGVDLSSSFSDLISRHHRAGLHRVNFHDPAAAIQRINRWVEDQTENRIKDLLGPTDVNERSRLVLTNAVFFKGSWEQPFPVKATVDDQFRVTAERSVPVRMMNQSDVFWYAEADESQLLLLPYREAGLSMLVVLPKEVDGLSRLNSRVNGSLVRNWIAACNKRAVQVSLPTFRVASGYRLKPPLCEMGMPLPFTPAADFSPISPETGFVLHEVVHKAMAEVNEEGTVAAAATAAVVNEPAAMPTQKIITFRADHPFLFLICDTQSGAVLFIGRFVGE